MIDLSGPVKQICERLGAVNTYVYRLDITPSTATIYCYAGEDGYCKGKKYVIKDEASPNFRQVAVEEPVTLDITTVSRTTGTSHPMSNVWTVIHHAHRAGGDVAVAASRDEDPHEWERAHYDALRNMRTCLAEADRWAAIADDLQCRMQTLRQEQYG